MHLSTHEKNKPIWYTEHPCQWERSTDTPNYGSGLIRRENVVQSHYRRLFRFELKLDPMVMPVTYSDRDAQTGQPLAFANRALRSCA
jgi:hypothetical protein